MIQIFSRWLGQHEPEVVGGFDEQPVEINHEAEGFIEAGGDGVQLDGPFGDDLFGSGDVGFGFVLFEFEVLQTEGL
ncbi:MAG: hypothetical protein JO100_00185 [Pseudonocardia sp.]|nr:hypothetical protein [Pseudonocardia sp.]